MRSCTGARPSAALLAGVLLLPVAACTGSSATPAGAGAPPTRTSTREQPCGPRPAPASSASLETELSFPTVVTGTTQGRLTVRNTGSATVALAVGHMLMAVTVQGENLTSTGAQTAEGAARVDIAPGQERAFPVFLGSVRCGADGRYDVHGREIAHGDHEAVALLLLQDGRELASTATSVQFRSGP